MLGLRQIARAALPALMTALMGVSADAACLSIPQPDPEELRRDQEAIIHKAERLRDLMHTLLARYRTEGRTHHVKLLERGLEHLSSVGLVEDVAGIRDSLRDQALTEALRQQGAAIEDLERLLAILLDRRSIENLEQEIQTTTRLAAAAAELLRRQADLLNETREQTTSKPSEAEQGLLDRLAALAQKQRDESDHNQRSAGIRAPFLEDAMRRVQQLLEQQEQLEKAAEQQLSGRGALSEEARAERFRLGELEQAQRELFDRRSRDRALSRAAAAASDLKRAMSGSDDEAEREALSRLLGRLEAAASRSEPETKAPLDEWRRQLSELGARPDQRDALQRVADEIEEGAAERAAALREKSGAALAELEAQLEQAATDLAHGKPQQPGSSSQAISKAQKALAEAGQLAGRTSWHGRWRRCPRPLAPCPRPASATERRTPMPDRSHRTWRARHRRSPAVCAARR